LRGALTLSDKTHHRPFYLHLNQAPEILSFLEEKDAKSRYSSGVLTPDHVIRTKNHPLWLDLQGIPDKEITSVIETTLAEYESSYLHYFQQQVNDKAVQRICLDTKPRVTLVPGLGLITCGHTEKAAQIAGDIAAHTLLAKHRGSAIAPYKELAEAHIFDMEYWSLEQIKLGKGSSLPLAGQIALVTGGGGAIACGIGRMLLAAGAHVYLSDLSRERLDKVCDLLREEFPAERIGALVMDVTAKSSHRWHANHNKRMWWPGYPGP